MVQRTLAGRLAEYVCELSFEDLPSEVVEQARRVVLHDLAVALGGTGTQQGQRALAFVAGDLGTTGGCTIIGASSRASAIDAAFANTVMARALRMEDSILPSFIHPGAMLIPTALAIGEQQGSSGREVVAALVAGYDVLGRVAGSLWSWTGGGRTPSHVFGALGVAALVAKLLRLDEEQTTGGLAYAANLAAVISYGFQDFQYGLITRNGIAAAYLGQSGAPYPADAIEGPYGLYVSQLRATPPDLEARLGSLGREFDIMTAVLKPYPCTAINLVAIDLVRGLLRRHEVAPGEVVRIVVRRAREASFVPNVHHYGPFADPAAVTSSLPFALAASLADGAVRPERLARPNEPSILEQARGVEIELADGWDLLRHEVEITTVDGRLLAGEGDRRLLEPPDAVALLETYGVGVVGREKVRRLAELVSHLEELGTVGAITACLA